MAERASRINWDYLLEAHYDPEVQDIIDELGQTQAGRAFHSWVESEFSDLFDEDVVFEGEIETGRFDVYDGRCVYEIKTKHPEVWDEEHKRPYLRDVNQVEKYLEAEDLDAEFGILTYVNRGDLREVDEYLVNGGVTSLD